DASPFRYRPAPRGSGEGLADHSERGREGTEIGLANSVAVHRRHICAWRVYPRHDRLGENPATRIGKPHRPCPKRLRHPADAPDRFVETDHVRCQSPDLPPLLDVTSMPPITIARSI